MREQEAQPRRVEQRVARTMEAVAGEADTHSTSDEPVREGVLGEVRQQPARDYEACAKNPFPAGVPSERGRAEQPEDLDGVALGDGDGEPRRDASGSSHTSSFVSATGSMYTGAAEPRPYHTPIRSGIRVATPCCPNGDLRSSAVESQLKPFCIFDP